MLIVSITHLISLSIVILIFAMIVLIALHVWIHCCISFELTCRFSGLYIILISLSMISVSLFILIVIACVCA